MGSVVTTIKGYLCAPEGIIKDLDLTSAALWACIYALPERNPEEPGVKHIAQYTIGRWTGMARETVNRNLPRLLESGYLSCDDKRPGYTSGYRITEKIKLYAISEAKKTHMKFRIGNFIPIFRYLTEDCKVILSEAAVYGALYRNINNPIFDKRYLTVPEIQRILRLSNNTANRAVKKLISCYDLVEEGTKEHKKPNCYAAKLEINLDENDSDWDEVV